MGKPNRNNNNRKRESYFDIQIKASGERFLYNKTPLDIKKDANKIFKDIAYANLNLERDVAYFCEPSFVNSLYIEAYANLTLNGWSAIGLQTYMQNNGIDDINANFVLLRFQNACNAYSVLTKHLSNIINDINIGNFANIGNHLVALTNEIRPCREGLNCSFIVVQ